MPPETIAGRYRVEREVGRGGMGIVFEAVQESLGRHVALKVLPPAMMNDPLRLPRFHREARTAARMHHGNIVPIFEVGEQGELLRHVPPFDVARDDRRVEITAVMDEKQLAAILEAMAKPPKGR